MSEIRKAAKAQTQVEGQRIEWIFEQYNGGYFNVNRRYQRKLVWSLSQKESLIDSILRDIPIPLILLAKSEQVDGSYEIIDGLQRINAIISFLENKYSFDGDYFNLEALGLTKYLRDNGELVQQTPIMSRESSLRVAQYKLPVSTYKASSSSLVDETFRRINSSGRKLGMQEVRQAGSTSQISHVVRRISAGIRGDVSRSDYIPLSEMSQISLRWKEDSEGDGIPVEEIFWISERILRRDDLRSSQDEQLVLDLLVDILTRGKFDTSTEVRDSVYDIGSEVGRVVDSELTKLSDPDVLLIQFTAILQLMSKISKLGGKSWTQHTGKSTNNPAARFFYIAFRAFYTLMYEKDREVSNLAYVVKATEGYWTGQNLDLGGTWKSSSRQTQVRKFIGAIQDGFSERTSPEISVHREDSERLRQDYLRFASENRFYELKQGFTDLSASAPSVQPFKTRKEFVEKLIKTSVAMSNTAPGATGVIYVGISDSHGTTTAVEAKYGVKPIRIADSAEGLPNGVIGIDHEFRVLGVDLDTLLETIKNWILATDLIPESNNAFKRALINGVRPIRLHSAEGDIRTVISIHAPAVDAPIQYDGKFWERIGSSNHEFLIEEREIENLFQRYEEFKYRAM
ncbi:DUF262 domain-containing protein [Dietzia sp. E1]|uniref:DUF262 domain-containing protein n=1 Tax=Dietzia sp. E1 TaxID=328361 RepID=UPI0015FCAE62|nr:DUF262 domain-containing protein [Dietzia sp. E1]MBB1020390.1 DUF262 domain-containing protein [Dietzia sp. E1]